MIQWNVGTVETLNVLENSHLVMWWYIKHVYGLHHWDHVQLINSMWLMMWPPYPPLTTELLTRCEDCPNNNLAVVEMGRVNWRIHFKGFTKELSECDPNGQEVSGGWGISLSSWATQLQFGKLTQHHEGYIRGYIRGCITWGAISSQDLQFHFEASYRI